MKYLIIIFTALLISCTPQKRLQRLVKNNPELIRVDTIHFVDTIQHVTEEVHKDTVIANFSTFKDTLIINKDNLTVKTYYNFTTDSIYIFGECDSDTLYIPYEVKIPVEKVVVENGFNFLRLFKILMLLIIAVIFLFLFYLKVR